MPEFFQPIAANLTSLSALSTVGVLVQSVAGTIVGRTLTGTSNQVNISNGTGAAGNPTFSLPQSIATSSAVQFGSQILGDGATGNPRLNIDSPAGASPGIAWKTGGVFRWLFYTTNAESGSDAGSDLVFGRAFTDAGVGIDNPITITRAAGGNVTVARPLSCNDAVSILSGLTFSDNRHITTNATTGTKICTATSQKLAFWNATPVIQQANAAQAAVATTGATNVTPYGFTTAAQADAIVTLLNRLRTDLVTVGIIKGSA